MPKETTTGHYTPNWVDDPAGLPAKVIVGWPSDNYSPRQVRIDTAHDVGMSLRYGEPVFLDSREQIDRLIRVLERARDKTF